MAQGRKTKPLIYNLKDRGRQLVGTDRSNLDVGAMVNIINSPMVQERVGSNDLYGYYGHQVRQRFGMNPPETVDIDGKMVYLEPSFKTTALSADRDGNVTHQAEFLENESGEFARKQYLAKVGGFSTAVNYKKDNNKLIPSGFFGFDYVLAPNYATNIGDGQLFDGLCVAEGSEGLIAGFDSATDLTQLEPSQVMIARLLEKDIIQTYDSIHAQMALMQHVEQAYDQVGVLGQQLARQQRKASLQQARQDDQYTGMVGETRSFDSICQEAEDYLKKLDDMKTGNEHVVLAKKRRFFGAFG